MHVNYFILYSIGFGSLSTVNLGWNYCQHVNNMSITDKNVVNFCQHCNLLHCKFLEIPCMWESNDCPEKKLVYFQYIFEFFGTRGVHYMKKEKTCLEVPIFPQVWQFLSFCHICIDMLHVACCTLVLVLQNVEMLQYLMLPTELPTPQMDKLMMCVLLYFEVVDDILFIPLCGVKNKFFSLRSV